MTEEPHALGADTLVLHGGGFRHDPMTSATTVLIYQSTSFDFLDTAAAIRSSISNRSPSPIRVSATPRSTLSSESWRRLRAAQRPRSGQAATAPAVLTLAEVGETSSHHRIFTAAPFISSARD
jgi:O-acetylhomoserine/O-acetylserine sulfhydrylase-like pyridoxal-dependent enzyme